MKTRKPFIERKLTYYSAFAVAFIATHPGETQVTDIYYIDYEPDLVTTGDGTVTPIDINVDGSNDFNMWASQGSVTYTYSGNVVVYSGAIAWFAGAVSMNVPLGGGEYLEQMYEGQPMYAGSFADASTASGELGYVMYFKARTFINGSLAYHSSGGLWDVDGESALAGVAFHTGVSGYGWLRLTIDLPPGFVEGGGTAPIVSVTEGAYIYDPNPFGFSAGDTGDTATAATQDLQSQNITLNVNNGVLYITDKNNTYLNGDIAIIAMNGAMVYSGTVSGTQMEIPVHQFAKGIYSLVMHDADKQYAMKLHIL